MEALGICIDGNEVKCALLRKSDKKIEVVNLEKIFIEKSGSEAPTEAETAEGYDDVFGLKQTEETEESAEAPAETESNLLFNTISKYIDTNPKIGMNILQSNVSFTNITKSSEFKGKKLEKAIKEELDKLSKDIEDENFSFIQKNGDEFIAFYHNKKLDLLDEVQNVKSTLKSDIKIELIDINEISLINLFNNITDVESEFSILIFVGNEYSRILFFEGKKLISFSQLINEGYHSEVLANSLYGKIIFEHDTAGLEEINNIFITGDGDLSKYETFFKEKFQDSNITKLPFAEHFSILDEKNAGNIDSFALPVSIAWKILEGKERAFIDTNFLPSDIKKQQKAFTITWHGLLLFTLILLSIGYFFYGNRNIKNDIIKLKSDINQLDIKINSISPVVFAIDSIASEIGGLMFRGALVDTLRPKNMLYSDLLKFFADNVKDLNSIWITKYSSSFDNFDISGMALYKTRIHQFANVFEESKINDVSSQQIMGKNVYTFSITGKIPKQKR